MPPRPALVCSSPSPRSIVLAQIVLHVQDVLKRDADVDPDGGTPRHGLARTRAVAISTPGVRLPSNPITAPSVNAQPVAPVIHAQWVVNDQRMAGAVVEDTGKVSRAASWIAPGF